MTAKVSITVTGPQVAAPSLKITSPTATSTAPPGDVTVSLQVTGFNLTDKLGKENAAGEGHIHYFIDVDAPTTPGKPAVTGPGTYAASTAMSYTWKNVAPGWHSFSAEMVNNDHTPLTPPVVAMISTVVAQPGTPEIAINVSAQGFSFSPGQITVPPATILRIAFNNRDAASHNIAIYEDASASRPVFKGEIIAGPSTTTYQLLTPSKPGTYLFRCDVYPTMTAAFRVFVSEY